MGLKDNKPLPWFLLHPAARLMMDFELIPERSQKGKMNETPKKYKLDGQSIGKVEFSKSKH